MMFRCFAFATFATLAASPAAQADPADDLRWYNDQPVTMMELALRDLTTWMSNELNVEGGYSGSAFAYMDEANGPIVLSYTVPHLDDSLELCAYYLNELRRDLFHHQDNHEYITQFYATLFMGHSASTLEMPSNFSQSIAELTVLEITVLTEGSCRMSLLGSSVTYFPND